MCEAGAPPPLRRQNEGGNGNRPKAKAGPKKFGRGMTFIKTAVKDSTAASAPKDPFAQNDSEGEHKEEKKPMKMFNIDDLIIAKKKKQHAAAERRAARFLAGEGDDDSKKGGKAKAETTEEKEKRLAMLLGGGGNNGADSSNRMGQGPGIVRWGHVKTGKPKKKKMRIRTGIGPARRKHLKGLPHDPGPAPLPQNLRYDPRTGETIRLKLKRPGTTAAVQKSLKHQRLKVETERWGAGTGKGKGKGQGKMGTAGGVAGGPLPNPRMTT